jgi:hypothetical protein
MTWKKTINRINCRGNKMELDIEIGDSIVIAIDGKALSGKVAGTRTNDTGNHVIEMELYEYCGYKIVRK